MKNRCLIKLAALLVSVCYIVAFLGFDVHICSDDGHVYIGFLVNGISCENLHPDTPCHSHGGCCCCECEGEGCEEGEDCCSDSIQRITLPGSGDDSQSVLAAPVLPLIAEITPSAASCCASISNVCPREVLKSPPPPDLSLLCNYRA